MSQLNIALRLQIYDRLINWGLFQFQISKRLGIKPQLVQRHVKALINGRFIEEAYPESTEAYHKSRGKGLKVIPAVDIRSTKFKAYKKGPNAHEYDRLLREGIATIKSPQIRIHHTAYKMELIKRHDTAKPLSDNWRIIKVNRYFYYKLAEIPYESLGNIKIRWNVSYKKNNVKSKESILIFLPDNIKYYLAENGDIDRGKIAYEIQKWFGRYGYQVSLPIEKKCTHYAIDTGIKAEGFGKYEMDKDTWIDKSKGTKELETTKPEIANTWAEMPNRLFSMDNHLNAIESEIKKGFNKFSNKFEGLVYKITTDREEDIPIFRAIGQNIKDMKDGTNQTNQALNRVADNLEKLVEKKEDLEKSVTYQPEPKKSKKDFDIGYEGA